MNEKRAETNSVYTERYVAFIDILGFSDHVRRSAHAADEAEKLIGILNRIARTWTDPELQITHSALGVDFRSTSFSDCTVLSEAATPKALQYLVFRATQFALDLLANGFLLRGAIAKGLLHHSEHAIFGPAFLNAYDSERNVAKYPRIIVDQRTHEDFVDMQDAQLGEAYDRFIGPNLRHDDDGPVFVDIFSGYRNAEHIPYERVRITGDACRENIQAKLDQSIYNPAHYEKLRWLAIYWNGVRQQAEHVIFPVMRDFRKRNGT
jgi:hypothetical protein